MAPKKRDAVKSKQAKLRKSERTSNSVSEVKAPKGTDEGVDIIDEDRRTLPETVSGVKVTDNVFVRTHENGAVSAEAAAEANITYSHAKGEDESSIAEPARKKIKFRNYRPIDTKLLTQRKEMQVKEKSHEGTDMEEKSGSPQLGHEEPRSKGNGLKDPAKLIQQELHSGMQLHEEEGALASRRQMKPHQDLKTLIEPKLLKLRKKTTRAIIELLRDRLKNENAV